jgi:predicted negative regulator of RcsB-dependent stress response
MATLATNESNILDAETINWRLIVYPILAALVIVVGGFGYYYYLQGQREELETNARAALVAAKTPEDMVKVADQFPNTDHATIALLGAAQMSFSKQDYASAITDYQRVMQTVTTDPELRDSAEIGLASAQEASGKADDAITSYLEVARRGIKSPYAPFAYNAAAQIYDQRGDKANEQKILTEAAGLDPDSPFVKQAQEKLKEMEAAAQPPISIPVSASAMPPPTAPATPAPAQK